MYHVICAPCPARRIGLLGAQLAPKALAAEFVCVGVAAFIYFHFPFHCHPLTMPILMVYLFVVVMVATRDRNLHTS